MFKKKLPFAERRRYIRLNSVFPVEFQILGVNNLPIGDWKQGFTSNVSAGGICLTLNNPDEQMVKYLGEKNTKLSLRINIPIVSPPINALASIITCTIFAQKDYNPLVLGEFTADEN